MTYFDTSIICAYYFPEPHSKTAERLIIRSKEPIISQLVEVEIASALFRKIREHFLSKVDARRIFDQFKLHVNAGYYVIKPIEPHHYALASEWIARFDSAALRTLDALHLAVAFEFGGTIVTADTGQAKAARQLGIEVIMP